MRPTTQYEPPGSTARECATADCLSLQRDGQVETTANLRYLNPEEYAAWDALVDASPQGNVLCRSWWLKALPGDVQVLGYFRGGKIAAGIPLYFERWFRLKVCRMPKLVHTWGVVMRRSEGKVATTNSREMEILTAFASHLAGQRYFVQSFHPSLLNWLPFHWKGFRQTTQFGYVLELRDKQTLWDEMGENVRRNIRKAEKLGITIVPCDCRTVAAAAESTFRSQRKPLPFSHEYIERLCEAARQHDSGVCLAAVDKEGRIHGAIFVAWDWKRAYLVAGGADPELRSSGAQSMLIWHTLNFLLSRTVAFDFAGSMVQGIENFFRHFGATLVPYNRILKLPRLARACMVLAGVQ